MYYAGLSGTASCKVSDSGLRSNKEKGASIAMKRGLIFIHIGQGDALHQNMQAQSESKVPYC